MPMFPVAPPPRDDEDQAPIVQQVEAAPGEIELDAVVRAQSSAPQVVERLTTLEDCLWAAANAESTGPVRRKKRAPTLVESSKLTSSADRALDDAMR
jgi:hypothetical protein